MANISSKITPRGNENGLVSCWDFSKQNNGLVQDIGSLGNVATRYGHGLAKASLLGSGQSFDGVDDYYTAGSVSSYSFIQNTGIFTISAWIKLPDVMGDTAYTICGNMNDGVAGKNGFWFCVENRSAIPAINKLKLFMTQDTYTIVSYLTGDRALATGDFAHVVVVGNGTRATFYINGIAQTVSNAFASLGTGNSFYNLGIGVCTYPPYPLYNKGNIYELEIYNRALSSQEVATVYNRGKNAGYIAGNGINISTASRGGIIGSYLENTKWQFGDTTGRYTIVPQTINGRVCKALTSSTDNTKFLYISSAAMGMSPSEAAYGQWEWSYKTVTAGQSPIVGLIGSVPKYMTDASYNGYLVWVHASNQIWLCKYTAGVLSTIFSTANAYTVANTWYRFRVIRTVAGAFYVYIKGGIYTGWTLASAVGGSGSNPVTDTSFTTSNFGTLVVATSNTPYFILSDPSSEHSFRKTLLPCFPT